MRKLSFLTAALAIALMLFAGAAFAGTIPTVFGDVPEGYQVYGWGYIVTSGKIGFTATSTVTIPAKNWHPPAKIPYMKAGKILPELLPILRPEGITYRAKSPGRLKVWSPYSVTTGSIYVPIDTSIVARRGGASIEYAVTGTIICPMDSLGFKSVTTDTLWYGVLYKVD